MDDVVNSVVLQGEDLSKSSSDLITEEHGFEGEGTIDVLVLVGGSDRDWVEVIVAELSSLVTGNSISVPEDGTIGVPLSHGGGIGANGLFGRGESLGTEASGVSLLSGIDS